MLDHAEYLVWVSEVDAGEIEHPAAEEQIQLAYRAMRLVGCYFIESPLIAAVYRMLSLSQRLFEIYLDWQAVRR